eukprot:GHVT01086844.1.p2 GENE.GHVT01086844.1~~GHVT01086844.1.p2  ORF type:complete len:129 (-),score=30.86 GHVT01086844.1:230-583(-)
MAVAVDGQTAGEMAADVDGQTAGKLGAALDGQTAVARCDGRECAGAENGLGRACKRREEWPGAGCDCAAEFAGLRAVVAAQSVKKLFLYVYEPGEGANHEREDGDTIFDHSSDDDDE